MLGYDHKGSSSYLRVVVITYQVSKSKIIRIRVVYTPGSFSSPLTGTIRRAFEAANNNYAGFGPATANSFRKMVSLREAVWEEMKQKRL